MILRQPRVTVEFAARAALEARKIQELARLAAREDLDVDGEVARYLARKLARLGRRIRIDLFARAA
jgi:hypothetical protein